MEIIAISRHRMRYDLIIPPNLLLKMKLLTFFLLVVLTQAWGTGYGQKIYLEKKNVRLESALKAIEKQTSYLFLYDKMEVPVNQRVSVSIHNESIEETLDQLFSGLPLSYKIFNKNIVIRKDLSKSAAQSAVPPVPEPILPEPEPFHTVTGRIVDESGEGLPGVSILIKGTQRGMISDVDGSFTIEVPDETTILVFSFVGYLSQEVVVGNRTRLEVVLEVDDKALEEVVVVGYGTQKKSDLTGSVARANINAFRESPNVNIAQSLQGTVPGLNIGQVSRAGQNPAISIRGRTTISGNRNVLLVVDGIIYQGALSDLNPNDIESVDVLKDASSIAIYGAQAANGVLLITTKQGEKDSKPVFNYTGSITTQHPTNSLTLMNREEFLKKSADVDWRIAYRAPDYVQLRDDYSYLDVVIGSEFRNGYENGTDYDWWRNTTNPGHIMAHNLGVSGSSGAISYYMSGGFTRQKGFVMNDLFNRSTFRINLENRVLSWFKIGAQTSASFMDYSGVSPNLSGITIMSPLISPTDEEGNQLLNPNGTNNPNPFLVSSADDLDKQGSLFGNFYADLDIPFIKGLNYRLNFGNNYAWSKNFNSNPYSNGASGGAFKANSSTYDWTLDNILNYKKKLGERHNLGVTLVYGRRQRNFEQTEANGVNYTNLRLSYHDLSLGTLQTISSGAWEESYLYQMARVNYEYNYKYLFTATIRRDGFSGFARNRKTALFPSVGVGWIASEESFLEYDWLNHLKFRISYGTNGNLVNRYASLARVSMFPAYVFGEGGSTLFGQQVTSMGNPNLSWETTAGLNFGIDFALLKSRLTGSLDFYKTTTNDLIYNVSLPQITGFGTITTNIGNVANKGGELTLNAKALDLKGFQWNINFNMAANRNKIVSLLGLDLDGDGKEDDLVASGLFIGQPISAIFDYESAGIIQLGEEEPSGFFVGTHRIVDQNNDGVIDPYDRVIRGRQDPAFNFGILNEFNYRNFTLRVFINSIQGGKRSYLGRNQPSLALSDNGRRNNLWKEVDYWTPSNPGARYRGLVEGAAIDYAYYGNRSFVRLQDVTLAYTLPVTLAQRIGVKSLKIFGSGKNLATWTDWVGWDPETGAGLDRNGMPVMRGVSAGIDLSF